MAATTTQSQYGRNCTKGIPCGNTCISVGKKCRKSLPNRVALELNEITNPNNLEKGAESSEKVNPLTEKYPPLSSEEIDLFEKESTIGENTVRTTIADDFFQSDPPPPPTIQTIGIQVNGSYDKTPQIEGKDGLKLALASREHVREYVKSVPDGTVLANTPHTKDGFGNERARLYEKAGFSPRDQNGVMYSIVSGGKNIPITLEEIKTLKESGRIK